MAGGRVSTGLVFGARVVAPDGRGTKGMVTKGTVTKGIVTKGIVRILTPDGRGGAWPAQDDNIGRHGKPLGHPFKLSIEYLVRGY